MWTRLQQPMGLSFKEAAGIRHSLFVLIPGTTWIIYLLRQLIKGLTTLPPHRQSPSNYKLSWQWWSVIKTKKTNSFSLTVHGPPTQNIKVNSGHSPQPHSPLHQPLYRPSPCQTTKPFKPVETNIVPTEYVLGINKWAITKLRWSPCSLYLSLSEGPHTGNTVNTCC